jgi:hypothetical protein
LERFKEDMFFFLAYGFKIMTKAYELPSLTTAGVSLALLGYFKPENLSPK